MAEWVTSQLVQQWLEQTKLTIARTPDELDQTAHDVVFGRASQVYDVSTWVSAATTPSLVLRIMSMLIAAWYYEAAYSEDLEIGPANYGVILENRANSLLQMLVDQTLIIPDEDFPASGTSEIVFYPTDAQENNGEGEETKFKMGKVF